MDSSTIAVDLGANLMIDCLGSVGDLSWTKDGSAISNSSEDERVYQQGDSRQNTLKQTLFVTNFTGEDPGNYTCSSTFEGIDTITVSLKYCKYTEFMHLDYFPFSLQAPPRPDCQNISSDCKSELCMDFCGTTEMCTPKTVTDMVPSSNQCEGKFLPTCQENTFFIHCDSFNFHNFLSLDFSFPLPFVLYLSFSSVFLFNLLLLISFSGREICIVVAAVLGAILFLVIFFICTALLALGCYMHNRKSPKEPEIEIIENEATDDPLANSLRLKPNESTSSSFKKLEEDSSL